MLSYIFSQFLYAFSITPLKSMDPKRADSATTRRHGLPIQGHSESTGTVYYTFTSDLLGIRTKNDQNPPSPGPLQASSDQGDLSEQNFFFDPKALAAGKKRKQRQEERRGQGGGGGDGRGLLPNPKRHVRDGGEK